MAEDIRRQLLTVEGVQHVTVRVKDHAASAAIEAGVNSGKSFAEAFARGSLRGPGRTTRVVFAERVYQATRGASTAAKRPGYRLQKSVLCICGMRAGWHVCYRVQAEGGTGLYIEPDTIVRDYLDHRAEIGLDCRPAAAPVY